MVDDPSSATSAGTNTASSYDWLRWTVRLTGIVLMLGGTLYLAVAAAGLLLDKDQPVDIAAVVLVSVVALGLAILVLRIGYRMLRTVDATTISHFSLIFALIYTPLWIQLLPESGLFHRRPALTYLVVGLAFGLSYWIVQRILVRLLLPPPT